MSKRMSEAFAWRFISSTRTGMALEGLYGLRRRKVHSLASQLMRPSRFRPRRQEPANFRQHRVPGGSKNSEIVPGTRRQPAGYAINTLCVRHRNGLIVPA